MGPNRPYRSALSVRLATEFGDAALADAVVAGLDDMWLAQFEARVPLRGVATDPLLAYLPVTVPAADVDSVLVFAFGNRVRDDGAVTPGPTNDALAVATAAFVATRAAPIFAQWEVAESLVELGVSRVTSIEPEVGSDGEVVYLSTAGVVAQADAEARAAGVELGVMGVIGFADHVMRCVLTVEAVGLDAGVPAGAELPSAYDLASAQPWTRDRGAYLALDLIGRVATL